MIFSIIGFLIGAVLLGTFLVAVLSVASAIDIVLKEIDVAVDDEIAIVDPDVSSELQRIAKEKSSSPHARFMYTPKTGKTVLVEGNDIDDDLRNHDYITVKIT